MWRARKRKALLGAVGRVEDVLLLRWGKTVFIKCLLCAGCFPRMNAFNLHNFKVGISPPFYR